MYEMVTCFDKLNLPDKLNHHKYINKKRKLVTNLIGHLMPVKGQSQRDKGMSWE
jgi:hypothetical protein